MPSASRRSAPDRFEVEGFSGAYAPLAGGYTVAFEEHAADMDPAPLFRGLPDDRCQCPHWGYVLRGRLMLRFADRDEVYEAGQAYYAPPGHLPVVFAGTSVVEFSPTEGLGETMAVIGANLAAAGAVRADGG